MLSHLRLVVSVSRKYLGYGLPHGDLIQEGNIGLMKAVKRFDPDQGVRLVSYALHWIKAEIHEYILKNWRMVKVATTKAQRKLFFNLRSMKQGFKDDADAQTHRDTLTDAQIDVMARELNVKREEVDRDGNPHVGRRRAARPGARPTTARKPSARSPTWPTPRHEPTAVTGEPRSATRMATRRHRRGAGSSSTRAAAASSKSAG